MKLDLKVHPPSAQVYLDGNRVGSGSCELNLQYFEIVAVYERTVRNDQGDTYPEREERNKTIESSPHVIRITETGYQDIYEPITIEPKIALRPVEFKLQPLKGFGARGRGVKCELTIVAIPEYFPKIEHILKSHAVKAADWIRTDGPTPSDKDLNLRSYLYKQTIPNIGEFGNIVQELEDLATAPDKYSLTITDATLSAKFDTNTAEIVSKFTISGNVRANSKVFLLNQSNPSKADRIETVGQRYNCDIRLATGQDVIYVVSVYRPRGELSIPVAVYLRQRITESVGSTIPADEFLAETGFVFSQEDIDKLYARD